MVLTEQQAQAIINSTSLAYKMRLLAAGVAGPKIADMVEQLEEHIAETLRSEELISDEACPGCGALPGEGLTPGCEHPNGCGYWREHGNA